MRLHKLRIFLADDHAVLREGLAALIGEQMDMEVIGQASDGRIAIDQIRDCRPDVAVIDVSMPGLSGAQLTAQLLETCPEIQVVALTRHSEPGYVRQMLQAGARGYMLKQTSAAELLSAIRAVAEGRTHLDTAIAGRVVQSFVRTQAANEGAEADLSAREADVVRLTAFGYSNKEIATRLGISVKTVDTYKNRAMEKLGLHSRAALVRYAMQRGWFDES
ncbi:MAG TPA: response regulator transcription factor [Kouleothrix sp.]|nr:response regulator transcription factor [Kouleothrix sp.]HRC74358.1 response regulator transcription factor [Kouleothrix sp.]